MTDDNGTTHPNEWEGDEPYNLGEWPDDKDTKAWVEYALKLLANELFCALKHVESGKREDDYSDWIDAAMHLSNIAEGIRETTHTLFQELLTDDEKITATMLQMQKDLGIPMKVVEKAPGIVAIVPDWVVVPPNVDEMLRSMGLDDDGDGV